MADEHAEYEFVMPFVICASEGGPYDDAAFVAGINCGLVMAELKQLADYGALPSPRYVRPEIVPQLDLIAMRHGYLLKPGETDQASGWQRIDFEPTTDTTPDDPEET